jgi:FkbM family methyltransferase
MFVSYAQNFEDVLLWRALGSVGPGFYIDVGAAHPDTDSVTRAFYDRGWHGVNIEPVSGYCRRLAASRPRDINICVALGEAPGERSFYVVEGTGLSTLHPEALPEGASIGRQIETTVVTVETLAEICRQHARPDIHFLKIDAEGAEAEVLAGADFRAFRPWIVLVEATAPMSTVEVHGRWEPILLAARYHFVWFDGLNRFYIADEQFAQLAPAFRHPPNVFDNFLRAADTEWARRIHETVTRADALLRRAAHAEARLKASERAILWTGTELAEARALAARSQAHAEALAGEIDEIRHRSDARELGQLRDQARTAGERARQAQEWLLAMQSSTSWRLTAPLRRVLRLLRGSYSEPVVPHLPAPITLDAEPEPEPASRALAMLPHRGLRRIVHQFHSGSAVGDAITNAMLMTRSLLRSLGYESEIFVENVAPGLADELRPIDELPRHDGYVLILRHSMGYDAFERVVGFPAPKLLLYHNITPPQFLDDEWTRHYADLGRSQLASLPNRVAAALADSEYNVVELRRLGFAAPRTCALLFDVDTLVARAAAHDPARGTHVFTILFVGRIIQSKGQLELAEAFARFHRSLNGPSRLVLVGTNRHDGAKYLDRVMARARAHGVEEHVIATGFVSDETLHDWYSRADLYVSLSQHEGFGVPLVEAMAHGVPVLAWPSGAVPYTLGGCAELLDDRAPSAVAARMLELARDPDRRARIAERQREGLGRFRLQAQVPSLVAALTLAGAAPPELPETAERLRNGLRFTVFGHVNKTYSLAAINRAVALAIEAERPGTVRLVAVEGEPTLDLSEVPQERRSEIAVLAARPPHVTGPEIVISQHYPIYVPANLGDAALALFFWEESLVPADTVALLNRSFRAVLTASRFVAKALVDSGLSIPVHVVGHAPLLDGFHALGRARADRRRARGDGVFTFLHVSSAFPRKGVDVLLAAYAKAFRASDPVRLVIKTFPNQHNDVADQLRRLRAGDAECPAMELIDRDLDESALRDLYAQADAIVLPTRGEGFNLPAAEAMAAGLPVIVTGFGGHMDFCSAETARLVDHAFTPSSTHLAMPHSVWAEPNLPDLMSALLEVWRDRQFRQGIGPAAPDATSRRTARAQHVARAQFDRAAFANRVADAAVRALLRPAPSPVHVGWISTWGVRCGVAEYSRHMLDHFPASSAISRISVFADMRTAVASDRPKVIDARPAWQLGHPDGVADLLVAIAAQDPDIVVLQHQPGLFGWETLAQLLDGTARRRMVVTLHNTRDILDATADERHRALSSLAAVSRVVVHTTADLNLLRVLGLVDNVTLLPQGTVKPPRSNPAQDIPRNGNPHRGPVIGSYGFFLPDKGLRELIGALVLLRRTYPLARLRLVNAEYDHPISAAEIAACRAAAAAAGVGGAIEWCTDFLPDERSLELLSGCDAVVLPYQRSKESSSAALRMALASGAPVMVSDLPLFDEAGDAVLHSNGRSETEIAADLTRLLDDLPARARLQETARIWLADRDWETVARRFQGMLVGLCAQPRFVRTCLAREAAQEPIEQHQPALAAE